MRLISTAYLGGLRRAAVEFPIDRPGRHAFRGTYRLIRTYALGAVLVTVVSTQSADSGGRQLAPFDVPTEVVAVFHEFRTAELTTIGKDGSPATWPITVAYRPDRCEFVTTTSIGLPQKAVNIRRNPRVSLLFSEPRASKLEDPPAVLVQGEARADEALTSIDGVEDVWEKVYRFQPSAKQTSLGPLMKRLMGWYYIRIAIHIVPARILWWPQADFSARPLEVPGVG